MQLKLEELSLQLNKRFGEGFSVTMFQECRKFYLTFVHRLSIQHPLGANFTISAINYKLFREKGNGENSHQLDRESPSKQHPAGVESATGFHPDLSWSHYRVQENIGYTLPLLRY